MLLPDDPATTTVTSGGLAARVSGTVERRRPAARQRAAPGRPSSWRSTRHRREVDECVTVGDDDGGRSTSAGPYLRVSATDVVLSIAGQTLTGDVAFERNSSGTTVLTVAQPGAQPGRRRDHPRRTARHLHHRAPPA